VKRELEFGDQAEEGNSRQRAFYPDSLSAHAPPLGLQEVVAIKHPEAPRWSPDGKWLAWRWDDGGLVQLWVAEVDVGNLLQVSKGKSV